MNFYWQIDQFVETVSKNHVKPGKKILDIGAESCKYKPLFTHLKYYSQDIRQNNSKTIDYVGNFSKIKSASFDYILCTQVLEHLKDPHQAFKEFKRILKPNGQLFLTTNFIYQIHMAPHDYFRFTEHGLRLLGKTHGFKTQLLRAQGGIFGVLAYILTTLPLRLGLDRWQLSYWLYLVLFSPLIMIINLSAMVLDNLFKTTGLTINYEAIYKAHSRS
jgi:SAM-dependent methyltransferase